MKVLHTIDSLAPEKGGTSRSVPRLTRALAQHGVDVALVDAASLHSADHGVDVIHDHGVWLPANHRSASLAATRGVPFVLSPRGMLEPWSLAHHRLKKRVAWTLYQRRDVRRASLLHATSAMEAENLRRLGFRQPIAIIANGVDVPDVRQQSRRSERTALFLSRIHPKKGLLDLVSAWSAVRPRDWRVVIAGPDEGGHERDVRAAVAQAGLDSVFTFIGEVSDEAKWDWYHAADLFVLPSYSENFGTVVPEALASGVPVITTRGTPWAELETRQCGWWIEPNADALAETLKHATSLDEASRAAMGSRGRAFVEERFGWTRIAADMHSAYHWLLFGGTRPACIHT